MTSADDYWRTTLELCRQDVLALYHHRRIWREVRPALAAASTQSTTLLTHYDNLYVSTQIGAIRRLSDDTKDTASLVRLLTSLARAATRVTADLWIDSATAGDPNHADHYLERLRKDFEREWAAPGTPHLDGACVLSDRDEFAAVALKAQVYANRAIAHRHHGVFESDLTYAEIDETIDAAGTLLRRYEGIINDTHLAGLEPVISGDWLGPLRIPLFDRNHPLPPDEHLGPAPPWPPRT